MATAHGDVISLVRQLEEMRERDIELTRVESQLVWRYRSALDFYKKATLPGSVKNRIRRAAMDDLTIADVNALVENRRRDEHAGWREAHAAWLAEYGAHRRTGIAPAAPASLPATVADGDVIVEDTPNF